MKYSKIVSVERVKIGFLVFLIFFSISCSNEKHNDSLTTKDIGPGGPKYSMSIDTLNSFEKIFSLVNKISLEPTSQALLGKPWDLLVTDDKIIINDLLSTGIIHFFSIDGHYIGPLGSKGEGPGEYKSPEKIVVIDREIFVYDPSLLKIIVYDLSSREYLRSWKINNFYASIISINDKIVMLNKNGMGYKSDFEIYDVRGNKVKIGNFAKSTSEKKRRYMFGGSFRLSTINNNLLYIGADEFKIICYDISTNNHLWISQEIPGELKVPVELPNNIRELGIRWMIENYSSLLGFFVLENNLICILSDDYILVYDKFGNFRKIFKNPNRNDNFFSDGESLFVVTFENVDKNNTLFNPVILKYKVKN